MPRPTDSPDVAASKTLAYILRHGAEKEGIHIRSDGFIKLADVLARPKMRGVDLEMVLRLVEENAKQRFELFYGYDPSPPTVKPKKGAKGKARKAGKVDAHDPLIPNGNSVDLIVDEVGSSVKAKQDRPDAAALEDVAHGIAKAQIKDDASVNVELPLISLPTPSGRSLDEALKGSAGSSHEHENLATTSANGPQGDDCGPKSGEAQGEYFIRATQGHSIKLESTAHLEPVHDDEEGRKVVGVLVHGTRWELWDVIRDNGLSRMSRQHIHLAPALTDHRITPRPLSTLLIYLDLSKVLAAGIPVYTSLNGVVLTPGDKDGRIGREMWKKVERVVKGDRVVIWAEGQDTPVV